MAGKKEKGSKGLSVGKKENFSEWYAELVLKAELADYAPIKGFMIIRPDGYAIWQKIQDYFNSVLQKRGVRNVYFPLLVPDSFFKREAKHAEGFAPELAYIKNSEEGELLALRPTSETVMYDSYAKWLRSWRDLPLQLNQWCNVVRWEVKQTKPFLRTREFLWQEGHCAFKTREESERNTENIAEEYKKMVEELLAIPVIVGKKSVRERFPGAKDTIGVEALMPDGKALQMGTSHNLGQGFAKVFNVTFMDESKKEHYAWQTSWGFSTRLIGAVVMVHGDDKGLVLPPRIADNKVVVVPVIFEDTKAKVMKRARAIKKKLGKYGALLDDREGYSPGWKFNEWELKGIPLRIEIGPKDIAKKKITIVRRDNGKKEQVTEKNLDKRVKALLDDIQDSLFKKAKRFLDSRIDSAKNMKELKSKLKEGKIVKAYMVDDPQVEAQIKDETGGATSRIVQEIKKEGVCVKTGKKTHTLAYIAKAY